MLIATNMCENEATNFFLQNWGGVQQWFLPKPPFTLAPALIFMYEYYVETFKNGFKNDIKPSKCEKSIPMLKHVPALNVNLIQTQ